MPDDRIPVLLTREEWERVARGLIQYAENWTAVAASESRFGMRGAAESKQLAEESRAVNRAICGQAGLEEVFRCR